MAVTWTAVGPRGLPWRTNVEIGAVTLPLKILVQQPQLPLDKLYNDQLKYCSKY
ncbi:hypothetical protein Sjap_025092 [Stephania japonica]|uniref:Uncharacterized protein n=1 Tax=Stephania japonica TaxID=461633 RepID=A0AAP0E165_9MAGN